MTDNKDYEAAARLQFRDEMAHLLTDAQATVDQLLDGSLPLSTAQKQLAQHARLFRSAAHSNACPTSAMIAERMITYLDDLSESSPRLGPDLQEFLDRLRSVADMPSEPDAGAMAQLLRSLPVPRVFNPADIEIRNVEVLLVTPSKTIAKMAGAELAACGFRIVVEHDPIAAFGVALRTRPDFILAAMQMDTLNGVDLLCALHATSQLKAQPMALLTSDASHEADLQARLPAGVAIVHIGRDFADSFAALAARFNLG